MMLAIHIHVIKEYKYIKYLIKIIKPKNKVLFIMHGISSQLIYASLN